MTNKQNEELQRLTATAETLEKRVMIAELRVRLLTAQKSLKELQD